jgi:hypothetical protein
MFVTRSRGTPNPVFVCFIRSRAMSSGVSLPACM